MLEIWNRIRYSSVNKTVPKKSISYGGESGERSYGLSLAQASSLTFEEFIPHVCFKFGQLTVMCQETYFRRHPNLCARCGNTHAANRCHAWNAVCNKCRMVGHFARVCRSVEKKPKSNNSRKRDKERMTAFVRRKTTEAALPFINAEDDFILEMQINTSKPNFETLKRERDDLKCINIRLEADLKECRSQCNVQQASIQESNQKLQAKILELQNQNANEQRRRQAAENERNVQEYKTANLTGKFEKRNSELENKNFELQQELNDIKATSEQIKLKLTSAESSVQRLGLELQNLKQERHDLLFFNRDFTDHAIKLKRQHDKVKQEFQLFLRNYAYYKHRDSSSQARKNYFCQKCGSNSYHHVRDCAANGHTCSICGKQNHLAASCKNAVQPVELTSKVKDILYRIADEMEL